MKGKRFTTLIAIFVISLLACAATFGVTSAMADETNFGDYFTFSNASASVEEGKLVFDITATNATVTSKYDFYLPATAVNFESSSDYTYTVNTVDATKAGRLEIKFTLAEGVNSAKATVSSITTDGKNLYEISAEGAFEPVLASAYVASDMKLTTVSGLVWGYNYNDVTFDAYHGFYSALDKEFVVVYGADETACDSNFASYLDEAVTDKPEEVVSYDVTKGATVKFLTYNDSVNPSYDCNFIKVYWGLSDLEDEVANYVSKSLTVMKELPEDTAPAYDVTDLMANFYGPDVNATDSEYADYLKEIDSATKTDGAWKYIGSSTYFNVPTAIYNYIKSDYFASEDLTYVIYYKLPESDTFTKLSSTSTTKRFALSKIGDYEYYVLATDPQDNTLKMDEEWELKIINGIKGFYDDADNLQVPVFSFYMGNKGPQVTAGASYQDPGYVGSSYTDVDSFTVKGNDVSTEYVLLYNANDSLNEYDDSNDWKAISTAEEFAEVFGSDEDFETLAWSESALSFTPTAIGSYVVKCVASDSMAKTATATTKVINVKTSMSKVEINTVYVWFENNWLSILFLGLAVLSFIGIIVLIFVKPKEETSVDVDNN